MMERSIEELYKELIETKRQFAEEIEAEICLIDELSGASPSSVTTGLADLLETAFGQQLLSLIRLYGRSVYVP